MQMQIITVEQIATKNGQLRPNLVVAIVLASVKILTWDAG